MRKRTVAIAIALIVGAAYAVAQSNHAGHGEGMSHSGHGQGQPTKAPTLVEPGQGAFAALSEVVRVLEADPDTEWAKVDMTALRAHLVDMDRLILEAVVEENQLSDGLGAIATGNAETVATLRRMVPAHAAQLARDGRWNVTVTEMEQGVELRVTSRDPAIIARIKGLGFFGLMASQDHHREHHLMMARGEDAHAH